MYVNNAHGQAENFTLTSDSFEGQERDIIAITLTRSNPQGKNGFPSDIRRMNVGMNRAWRKLLLKLPAWFTELFNANYQSTRIFDDTLPKGFGLAPLPAGHQQVMVSVPERALLELFSDTGKLQSLEETLNVAESTRHLRPDVLDTLLTHTTRVKVVRLAKALAESLDLPWLEIAKKHNERLGSSSRWVAVTRDKKILHLKK